jgi:serine protease Do
MSTSNLDSTATLTSTAIATELTHLADSLRRSTVQVQGHQASAGSGVIWRSDGLIITNAHVVCGAEATVELADRRSLQATLLARDSQRDLAALQVAASDLPAAAIGNSDAVRVGELVLAVGNPLGLVGALTTGIVHAVGAQSSSQPWIQADVRLAPGNSGGLLANVQGHVIGINTMIMNGLALAIPTRIVERFLQQRGQRPHLGVTLQPVAVRWKGEIGLGLLVLEVVPDSLADTYGLIIGDILLAANGRRFHAPNDLTNLLSNANTGDTIRLDMLRSGLCYTRDVVLRDRPVANAA